MTAVDEIKIGGIGASRKRVEDNRFIRGKGNYLDDVVLPGMDGLTVCRLLKADPSTADVPLYMLTHLAIFARIAIGAREEHHAWGSRLPVLNG